MDILIVTNWIKTEVGEFYLSDEWMESHNKDSVLEARGLAEKGELFDAYRVPAEDYALFCMMDADAIFIDKAGNVILEGEPVVIEKPFSTKWKDCTV